MTGVPPAASAKEAECGTFVPWFVIAFVLLTGVRSVVDLSLAWTAYESAWNRGLSVAATVSELAIIAGIAAIWMRLSVRAVRSGGAAIVLVALAKCSTQTFQKLQWRYRNG